MTASLRYQPPDWLASILPGLRGQPRGTPAVAELPAELLALTTTTPAHPVPGGLTPQLFAAARAARRTLLDVIPEVPMSGGVLRVPTLTVAVDSALPHAEGAAKTEAGLTFGGADRPAQTIATYVRLTDELLDDTPALDGWLRQWLPYLVRLAEQKAILLSDGVSSKIVGFFAGGLIPAYAATGGETVDHVIAGMVNQVVSASRLVPDTVVINAADYAALAGGTTERTLLDYSGDTPRYAGLDLFLAPSLAAGQIVVGAMQVAAVVGREGPTLVEGTQSHATDFAKNISAVRAQSRIALGVLVPTAFVRKG